MCIRSKALFLPEELMTGSRWTVLKSGIHETGMRGMRLQPGALRTRVGIVSKEPMRQAGLASAFEDEPAVQTVCGDLEMMLDDLTINYLILDIGSSTTWTELLLLIRRQRPDIRQIVLGPAGDDELVLRSIATGARAYLDLASGPLQVKQAMETVMLGFIWAPRRLLSTLIDRLLNQPVAVTPAPEQELSPRERQVLELIMTARSNREISLTLGIEERTVKAYVTSLLRKTGADNRVALSVQATLRSQRANLN